MRHGGTWQAVAAIYLALGAGGLVPRPPVTAADVEWLRTPAGSWWRRAVG